MVCGLSDYQLRLSNRTLLPVTGKLRATLKAWLANYSRKVNTSELCVTTTILGMRFSLYSDTLCFIVLGSQEAAAIGQFEEKNARCFKEPRQKYRRVLPLEEYQQDEQVCQHELAIASTNSHFLIFSFRPNWDYHSN